MAQAASQILPTLPPGPKGRFLAGNAFDLGGGDWLGFFTRSVRDYGDVVFFKFFNLSMCLVVHPDDIEQVLVRNASNFVKSRDYRALKPVLGEGLLTSEGAA